MTHSGEAEAIEKVQAEAVHAAMRAIRRIEVISTEGHYCDTARRQNDPAPSFVVALVAAVYPVIAAAVREPEELAKRLAPVAAQVAQSSAIGYQEALDALMAASGYAPVAAVREQVAQEIEAFFPDPHGADEGCTDCSLIREVARIARGDR